MKLVSEQYRALSEISSSISVAWFTGGIISSFFLYRVDKDSLLLYFLLGTSMFGVFLMIALYFSGKINMK